MQIKFHEVSWWYWALTAILLTAGLTVRSDALYWAVFLSALQILHFRLAGGRFLAFPVQVRLAYTAILLLALWPPLHALFWVPAAGTWAKVLFGYCFLARCLSLLPINRSNRLSWACVWRTFVSPPVRGNILRSQPFAARIHPQIEKQMGGISR